MSHFVITAVRFNAVGDRVEKVQWSRTKGGQVRAPELTDEADQVDATVVVDALRDGDEVGTVFATAGGPAFGPNVHAVTYDDGSNGIEADEHDSPGRTLHDMRKF